MAFTTVRVHRSNFTQVPNDAMVKMLREKKTNAFGLYVFMASKPGTWEFQTSTIARQLNWSKSTVNRAMKDLEETGYMRRTRLYFCCNMRAIWNGFWYRDYGNIFLVLL